MATNRHMSEIRTRKVYIIVILNTSSSIQQFSAEVSSNGGPDRSLYEKMGMKTAHLQCPCSTGVSFHRHHKQGISCTRQQSGLTTHFCIKLGEFPSKEDGFHRGSIKNRFCEAEEGKINLGGVERTRPLPEYTWISHVDLSALKRENYTEREVHTRLLSSSLTQDLVYGIIASSWTLLVKYSSSWKISHLSLAFNWKVSPL